MYTLQVLKTHLVGPDHSTPWLKPHHFLGLYLCIIYIQELITSARVNGAVLISASTCTLLDEAESSAPFLLIQWITYTRASYTRACIGNPLYSLKRMSLYFADVSGVNLFLDQLSSVSIITSTMFGSGGGLAFGRLQCCTVKQSFPQTASGVGMQISSITSDDQLKRTS